MKKKIALIILGILVLLGVIAFITRDKSPISHYVSDEGKAKFEKAYATAMTTIPKPTKTLDLKTSFGTVRMYYFDSGKNDSEPIVLLPGRSASTPMWNPNLAALLKERSVYTVDLINEPGMSVQTKEIKDDADQAKWLNEALMQLPEKKVNIIGLSIGGWTATNYVVRYPTNVASVTLLDPVYVFDNIPLTTILVSLPASIPAIPTPIRNWMLSYISGGAPVQQDDPVAQLIETGMHTFTVKTPAPTRITAEQLGTLKMPVFALMAGRSVMNNPATAVANAKSQLKNGTVDEIAGASHAINGEYKDEVNKKIIEFLNTKVKPLDTNKE